MTEQQLIKKLDKLAAELASDDVFPRFSSVVVHDLNHTPQERVWMCEFLPLRPTDDLDKMKDKFLALLFDLSLAHTVKRICREESSTLDVYVAESKDGSSNLTASTIEKFSNLVWDWESWKIHNPTKS